jgi:magnesium transporter
VITSIYRTPEGTLKTNLDEDAMRAVVRAPGGMLWVDLHKPTPEEIFVLDEVFAFHPLAIEDCQHSNEYPKLDEFSNHLFLVLLAPNPKYRPDQVIEDGNEQEEPVSEIDLFVGQHFVVTHHSAQLPFLAGLLERARRDPRRGLGQGAAFLAHDIIDAAVDQFFTMVDKFQKEAEEAEEQTYEDHTEELLSGILEIKRQVLDLRRRMGDHRELIQRVLRSNPSVIIPESHIYFRNILDHLHSIEDDLDVCRDTVDNARDVYLALGNARSNEVMKTLTLVFTLSLPFSIITGWFGMNFQRLPFLEHWWAPWAVSGLMLGIAALILLWLRAKRWF